MIVVGATMTGFATSDPRLCTSWLKTAVELWLNAKDAGHDAMFFAAVEVDARGVAPFAELETTLLRLRCQGIPVEMWTYSYDDGRSEVTTANRLAHICAGRNIITDYACGIGASHILFLDADMRPPGDAIPKLLELNHSLVGGEVPTYGLTGPTIEHYPFPVQTHMNTAGFLLVARDVFRFIRWRWDVDAGMSDDPCYERDAREWLGIPTYVRKDVVGRHWPEAIPALEHRGYDRRVVRT